jgi:type III secretion protein L
MKFFSLLYEGDLHLATDEKIIPAEEFSTLLEASEILEKAKKEAALYKKENIAECERVKEDAREAGYQQGLSSFNEHIVQFEQELKKIRHEMHKQMLPLALKAAKKIINKQLDLHPDTIVDIVLQALAPVTQNHKITIYVNKADKEILEARKPEIKKIFEQIESLSVQERSDISVGGCVIETETGIINATIENQWRALEAAFERYMKH